MHQLLKVSYIFLSSFEEEILCNFEGGWKMECDFLRQVTGVAGGGGF